MTESLFAIQHLTDIHHLYSYCVFRPMHLAYFKIGCLMSDVAIIFQVPTCTIKWWYRLFGWKGGVCQGNALQPSSVALAKESFFMNWWIFESGLSTLKSHVTLRGEEYLKNIYIWWNTPSFVTCAMEPRMWCIRHSWSLIKVKEDIGPLP